MCDFLDVRPQNNRRLISFLALDQRTGSDCAEAADDGMDGSASVSASAALRSVQNNQSCVSEPCSSPLVVCVSPFCGDSEVVSSTTAASSTSVSIPSLGRLYNPNHPLSLAKHICAICGDRASGKHYGVYRLVLS